MDDNEDHIKKEEDESDIQDKSSNKRGKEEWKCLDCKKSYKSYPAFYTHNKLKHDGKPPQNYDIPRSLEDIRKDRGRPRVTDSSQRIKFTIQDKHQQKCEDNIYEFLGKLGQKGDESGQRDNTVIRGYLKKPIDPAACFPLEKFANDPDLQQHAILIKDQLTKLSQELADRNEWEFVDPLELKPDDMTEFSVYNLKSLFYILRDDKRIDQYTTLVVFFIWVSKELLESAYHEIVILSLIYINQYWEKILPIRNNPPNDQTQQQTNEQIRRERQQLKDNFFGNLSAYYNNYKLTLFDDQMEIQSYLEKFLLWYYHFDDNDPMDQQEFGQYNHQMDSNMDDDDEGDDEGEDIVDDQQQVQVNQPGGDSTTHINPENLNGNQD